MTKRNNFASDQPYQAGVSSQSHSLHRAEETPTSALCSGYRWMALRVIDPPGSSCGIMTPQEKWCMYWEAWKSLFQEMWYLKQEEPLSYTGKSILIRWLDTHEAEWGTGWKCHVPVERERWCEHNTRRLYRAIPHVRTYLGLIALRRTVRE